MSGEPTGLRVTVVIPSFQNPRGVEAALESLARQSLGTDHFEVIVVENGETLPMAERFGALYWKRVAEPQKGSYAARNRGIKEGQGDVFAFTDSDCRVDEHWLRHGLAAMDEETGFVAGRIQGDFEKEGKPTAIELYDLVTSSDQEEFVSRYHFGVTANLFVPRACFERIGLFDAQMFSGGDVEWGHRVHASGLQQVYAPRSIVAHRSRRTLTSLIAKSRRITVGTMRTVERSASTRKGPIDYYVDKVWRRPLRIQERAGVWTDCGIWLRVKVFLLYYLIKAVQLVERVRVVGGGEPRR